MATDEVSAAAGGIGDEGYPLSHLDIGGTAVMWLGIAGTVFLLHEASALFIPVLLSVLLAYALEPIVELLMRARLPRPAAALVTFMMLATALGAGVRGAAPQVNAFVDEMPGMTTAFKRAVQNARTSNAGALDQLQAAVRDLHDAAAHSPSSPPPNQPAQVVRVTPVERFDITRSLVGVGMSTVGIAASACAVVLLTFLLLATGDSYKHKIVRMAGPTFERRKVTIDVIRTIDRQIARYLLVRVAICVIVATATALPLWWLGVANAFVWGAVAGMLNILPFIGPGVACVLIAVAAFVQFQSIEMTAAAGGIAVAVATLEGNVITPWLTGRAGDLNTVAVFVSVLVWGWIWGIWGLLLAVPVMVAIKAAADHIEPLQPLGELLGR
jgi:predicted PurR-regulated permease PerM